MENIVLDPSLKSFIENHHYLMFDNFIEVPVGALSSETNFLKTSLSMFSNVHINFKSMEVTTVTKDVKVSVPDMIGTIGGTLGVFLGFSTLGMVQSLLDLLRKLNQWFVANK